MKDSISVLRIFVELMERGLIFHFYTARAIELGEARSQRILRVPRKLCFALHKELTVRILGGYSLPVLAR